MTQSALLFSLAEGGICHYTYALAEALQCSGLSARVLAYNYPPYELRALPHRHEVRPDLRMSHTQAARLTDPMRNLRTVLREGRRADVAHFQWSLGPRTDPLQWRALRRLGRPIVYTAHDVKPHERDILPDAHNQWLYRNADALIVHGQRLRQTLLEMSDVPAEKVHVVPHGNYNFIADAFPAWDRDNARASLGYAPDERVVLFFGLIRPYKGLDDLISACGLLGDSQPGLGRRVRLLIAGRTLKSYWNDGGYDAQIAEAGLAGQTQCVIEHIRLEDIGRFFRAADVVAIPYKSGSQSGVVQLAYAFGKPVIVTDVGSIPEAVQEGKTGLIVPPADPAAFAGALERLLGDVGAASEMGRAGRDYAEAELSWDRIAAQTRAIYAGLR